MNSSGIKRGLAASAIAALAVTGVPSIANAIPNETRVAPTDVELLNPGAIVSGNNDGTNATHSLVANAGADVTSVQFQYSLATAPTAFINVPGGLVARDAETGVFSVEWAPVEGVAFVRAVAGPGGETDPQAVTRDVDANTVEITNDEAVGFYPEPVDDSSDNGTPGDLTDDVADTDRLLVAVQGTSSDDVTDVTVDSPDAVASADALVVEAADAESGTFSGVLDITGYTFSPSGVNQTIISADATDALEANTGDDEGAALYRQTVTGFDASPATQEVAGTAAAKVVLTVTDQQGKAIAGAQVGERVDANNDGDFADAGETVINGQRTNGLGQVTVNVTDSGTQTFFVDVDGDDAFSAGDLSDTAVVTRYTPQVNSITISSFQNRTAFDLDEIADGDDFTITTLDQRGNEFDEDTNSAFADDVQYRWVIDPSGTGATITSDWLDGATDNGDGTYTVPGLTDAQFATFPGAAGMELPVGSYRLEARRPSVQGSAIITATPATYNMGEAELQFAGGESDRATVNGEYTATATLALADGTVLPGRRVDLSYARTSTGADVTFAPQASQPAGTTRSGDLAAFDITDNSGQVSAVLTDPDVPSNVTPTRETGTLTGTSYEAAARNTATTDDLNGTNGPDDTADRDGNDSINLAFEQAPTVSEIRVTPAKVTEFRFDSYAPGKPVVLQVDVFSADDNDADTDPEPLGDVPVTVTVNKGFLSPIAQSDADRAVASNELVLDEENDDQGDLFGFYDSLGQSRTTNSADTGNVGRADIVAAIEKDADFDDDGRASMTVTVEAGGVTRTETITFNSGDYLNLSDLSLERAAGEPTGDVAVPGSVDFRLFAKDQFGNLVGGEVARVTDNTPVADVDTDGDFGDTETDYTSDNVAIVARSTEAVQQTLTARIANARQALVSAADTVSFGTRDVNDSATVNWVEGAEPNPEPEPTPDRRSPQGFLNGYNNGGRGDNMKVNARGYAAGARVNIFRKTPRGLVFVRGSVLNEKGDHLFANIFDRNGRGFTNYVAFIKGTNDTLQQRTNFKRVR